MNARTNNGFSNQRDLQEEVFLARQAKLNAAQKKAVETTDGPLLVVAGPGSGKTEILSMRVAQILRTTHAFPSNILCLTFTDSAAQNMRDRLARLIGDRAYQVAIHTFHNFCVDIIRKHGEFFYHNATFSPADPVTQIGLLEQIFNQMEHDNPLKSYHPEMGYAFLKSTQSAIGHVKKSGLRPYELKAVLDDNEKGFDVIEKVFIPVIEKRVGKGTLEELRSALNEFTTHNSKREHASDIAQIFTIFHSVEESFALSVAEVIAKCEAAEKNEALSEWKKKWFPKNEDGGYVFRDRLQLPKMRSFVSVYEKYQQELFRRGYFDFDDMILDVISALDREPRLRFELQEQFQYLLVDEFQDTNNAQMRILSLLTSASVNEGRPNIMVVGDDDQAIYKFQGAELSNILDFRHRYSDVELVTMTENYRSTQDILNVAMTIIRKGGKRLENLIPDLSKELIARGEAGENVIEYKILETSLHEYKYVAEKIKSLINGGVSPEDIAVISRTHKTLEEIVPFMKLSEVPIKYEREQSVFAEPHIKELITMVRFIASGIDTKDHIAVRDDLLPEILSYSFWGISRIDIWKISLAARNEKKTWLEVMFEYDNALIKNIAEFFIELSVDAKSTPLERVIDRLVGAHIELSPDSPDEDEEIPVPEIKGNFISPFRSFYFSKDRFTHSRAEYLTFLSSLRVFINSLRAFNGFDANSLESEKVVKDEESSTDSISTSRFRILYVNDLVKFVDVYEQNDLKLNDESPFVTARKAVQLMSAHKSKGLEFKVVFVLSCQDSEWASKGGGSKLSFPINLPIEPAGDGEDDQLRLFYVALTRAREHLYLTSHQVKDSGKPASALRFLVGVLPEVIEAPGSDDSLLHSPKVQELLETAGTAFYSAPFLDTEEALLSSLVKDYRLSVTHLNNYLNIQKGGPRLFFEQNLLRFPQSKTVPGSYGSAIHATLEYALNDLKKNDVLPSTELILETFEIFLKKEKMHPNDYKISLKRGKESLATYFKERGGDFRKSDISEVDFGREHVFICDPSMGTTEIEGDEDDRTGCAFITGKIDKVCLCDEGLVVYDYKTGRSFESFDDPKAEVALKVHQYANQLFFYKLLIESSSFANPKTFIQDPEKVQLQGKPVVKGIIDFIEPVGTASNKRIQSTSLELEREQTDRLKKLAIAVYQRIKRLEFDLPDEIAKQTFKNDYEAVIAFEEYLLNSIN